MNSTKLFLRKLILEQVDELFSVEEEGTETTNLSKDSADDQIDSFILKFERDSVKSDDQGLSESLLNMSLSALIKEQDAPEEEEEEEEVELSPEEGGGDAPPAPPAPGTGSPPEDPPPATSAEVEVDVAEAVPKLPLDVDEFTKKVARLAMNYANLLDIKSIIVNRALSFLEENYDEAHSQEMKEILDTQFDFDLDGGSEVPLPPFAVGANPAGAGPMGGGGG